jgi:hypothetical protein
MKTCGCWSHGSIILNLHTRWRWVVSFMLQPLLRYPLYRRPGPRACLGRHEEERVLLLILGNEPILLGRATRSLADTVTRYWVDSTGTGRGSINAGQAKKYLTKWSHWMQPLFIEFRNWVCKKKRLSPDLANIYLGWDMKSVSELNGH